VQQSLMPLVLLLLFPLLISSDSAVINVGQVVGVQAQISSKNFTLQLGFALFRFFYFGKGKGIPKQIKFNRKRSFPQFLNYFFEKNFFRKITELA
jgi:hypothetical protein